MRRDICPSLFDDASAQQRYDGAQRERARVRATSLFQSVIALCCASDSDLPDGASDVHKRYELVLRAPYRTMSIPRLHAQSALCPCHAHTPAHCAFCVHSVDSHARLFIMLMRRATYVFMARVPARRGAKITDVVLRATPLSVRVRCLFSRHAAPDACDREREICFCLLCL